MKRLIPLILACCMLLTGCSWMDGSYYSVTPHQHEDRTDIQVESAQNYLQLRTALENMVSSGTESHVITVADFPQDQLQTSLDMAVRYVTSSYPIGAYAVEEISYEAGVIGGTPAVAVEITYRHEQQEIQSIRRAVDIEEARAMIGNALSQYDAEIVLYIENYQPTDIHQLVDDYVAEHPSTVMETPEITVQFYPSTGRQRVLELKFSFQTNRDSLRSMQEVVQRIFNSAALYVSGDAQDDRKLSQLYSFLMERFDSYQIKTSITPAYSLLNHGVGDSSAFARVYAEMCRRADVECMVVVGTKNGEPWCWNIVQDGEYYFHVDLLACQARGSFQLLTDAQMGAYVWDYSAYPACTGRPPEDVPEPPTQTTTPEQTTPPTDTGEIIP